MTDFFSELFQKPANVRTNFGAGLTPEEKECLELDESAQDKNSSSENE
jgi:hypothetical protein